MRRMDPPLCSARETFVTCIARVRSGDLKQRLEAATQTVVDASDAYADAAARQVLHEIPRHDSVAPAVTTAEMKAVYTDRMAKVGAPGRDYYDAILNAAPHGRCPLCAQRRATTLDHLLPKALFPALSVVPVNLVPACIDCNKAKLDAAPTSAEDVALHPYYDDLGANRWLHARVVHTRPAAVRFRLQAPPEWSNVLIARVRHHFRLFGLGELYAAEAAEELTNIRHQLQELLNNGSVDVVQTELRRRAQSCEAGRPNGWRTATYWAWMEDRWFCEGGFAG